MLQPDFLARFTTHLREALQKGLAFAIASGRDLVLPGDLLVGLLQERGSVANDILLKSNVNQKQAEMVFRGLPTPHEPGAAIAPDLSSMVKRALERSVLKAHTLQHKYVGTEHLLLSMLELAFVDVQTFLVEQGVQVDYLRDQLDSVLKTTSKFPDLNTSNTEVTDTDGSEEASPSLSEAQEQTRAKPRADKKGKALESFARELTSPEHVSKLDPVIGRDAETERLIEVLCRRSKNNPILLGDPGVGKTAVVEGLAQRLAQDQVPDILQGKRVYALDLALLVAGTMYRGEFESRLKQLVDEAKADPNSILFIDEIHNIVGAGSTSGSLDAANILKPALARGEIRCIGATTWAEYKKHIEPDAALERRYQTIEVVEPDQAQTLAMLQGLKSRYEEHHGVRYSPIALDLAVKLAGRYLNDRHFPDKAIDVLDEAAAHVTSKRKSSEQVERIRALEVALSAIREVKQDALSRGALQEASQAFDDETRLQKEKQLMEKQLKKQRGQQKLTVDTDDVIHVVARMLRVSPAMIASSEREQLNGLEDRLRAHLVGQDEAIKHVSEAIHRAGLGLNDPRRPKASLLFVGPSGVGKTEMAKLLAKEIFGREEALVRLDMTEFSEGHSVSKLLGSPAGYVGYREGNRLSDTIRKHPHSVLLFDEFEKAHADVQHLLLQALEDGKMTDSSGRPLSLKHSYIILTSNVGSEFVSRSSIGFAHAEQSVGQFDESVREQLRDRFRPELLNRLDRIVVFKPLQREQLRSIVKREMDQILQRLQDGQQVKYKVEKNVVDWLLEREMNLLEGARSARHVVEREMASLLGKQLIQNPKKKTWNLQIVKNQLVCK